MGLRDEFREGQEAATIRSYKDALSRVLLMGVALLIACLSPVPLFAKVIIFFAEMFVIGLVKTRSRKHKSPAEKADMLGARLILDVPKAATSIVAELREKHNIRLSDEKIILLIIEFFAFYMHIIDRMALATLGPLGEAKFAGHLKGSVVEGLTANLKSISPALFASMFIDTYEKRQMEYRNYAQLVPAKDESAHGTLFWEFSKVLISLSGASEPSALAFMPLAITTADEKLRIIECANEVLRGA